MVGEILVDSNSLDKAMVSCDMERVVGTVHV